MSSALRSIGDSHTPVIFLSLSCILNIGLDLLFIKLLHLGVAGAALATMISEGVSAVCCVIYIYRHISILRLSRKELVLDQILLKETLKIGSLTALQQAAQPVGKVLIQSVINTQGVIAIGAFNAVCRMDDFACIPAQSLGSGIMTCAAQNRGANLPNRVDETLKKGLLVALSYFPIICILTLVLKSPVSNLLTPDGSSEMAAMAVSYLSVKAWFFVMPCLTNAIQGYYRGMGRMNIVLLATLIQISVRTVCVYFWVPMIGINGEAYACLTGWACMCVFEFGLCFWDRHRH